MDSNVILNAFEEAVNQILFDTLKEAAEKMIFDATIKEGARVLMKDGFDNIWLQCQANGNTAFAEDVAREVKLHYDVEERKNQNDTYKN